MKTLVGGVVLGAGLYVASPKIPFVHYETRKELKNILGNRNDSIFVHEDMITTQILDFMSGTIDSNNLKQLLEQHGYSKESIENIKMREADPALYRALWEVHQKYANPRMSFKGNYSHYGCLIKNAIIGKDDASKEETVYPAAYNFNINTIKLYNLDSLPFSFDHNFHEQELRLLRDTDRVILSYSSPLSPQRILLNNWIAELSHAKQNLEQGPVRPQMNAVFDFVAQGLDYENCYDEKGTVEYEAHKEIEIDLTEEFIRLYALYSDSEDARNAWNLAKFYGGYFKNYNNEQECKKRLQICARKFDNPDAAFWLGNIALNKYNTLECENPEEAERKIDEAFERYTIAAENGSEEAVKKIISLSIASKMTGNLQKGLQWMKYLVKISKGSKDNKELELRKNIAFVELLMLDILQKEGKTTIERSFLSN